MGIVLGAGLCASFAILASCSDHHEASPTVKVDTRPFTQGCRGFTTRPGAATIERAYPQVSFEYAVQLVHHPRDAYWYVVEQGGTIRRFADRPDVSESELVVDLRDTVAMLGLEDGLLGLAFDPSFESSGNVIVKYTRKAEETDAAARLAVARLHSDNGGATFEPASLREMLTVARPQTIHHGGPPRFGADGYLYVPVGDGGWDPEMRAQDLSMIEGTVLRLDTSVEPYAVPKDNPFVGTPGARPEIFAYGLRNPFGNTFHPTTHELWVGDVGLATWEEIDRIVPGANYGWPIREGAHCKDGVECDPTGLTDPVHEYLNYGGSAIVVGSIYRGQAFPETRGHLIFGDFVNGRIEELAYDGEKAQAKLLVESGLNITEMTEDANGEILVVELGGRLFRLVPATHVQAVPELLSETGCMDMSNPKVAPRGLMPYEVNMPLWSDGADKYRWMNIPEGTKIKVREDGSWEMPVGTVLVKNFFNHDRPMETRLLVRHEDGEWGGYSYEWDADRKEARLLEGGKAEYFDGLGWSFPSRSMCMSCHNAAAGRTLGLMTPQLNREIEYADGHRENQITELTRAGWFAEPPGDPSTLAKFVAREDTEAPAADWARAYLHSNCSHCHRPGGPGRGTANFTFGATLAETGCGLTPELDPLGIENAEVIAPSSPEGSVLLARVSAIGAARMPPMGTAVVDALAIDHLREWIATTPQCD
ncbi:hypothetical protein AKJ09_03648 [Labilithrix luteola]|uniref:Glucose/Sorbosone dehydrogenase domain-containing protein n=1 Tax=Labilithrix luteola TaxID=1391654 RepID=A0A0K1PV22_9BACT|nr:PQQ-dependent sugar dehydrogenase [Labilithrix luteola]AKU96984.1 hypothetical protein AKJ09_03648 [Labilithrix luteola]